MITALAGIGHNRPPTIAEEIASRQAGLLADIQEVVATELPMMVTSESMAALVSQVGKDATDLVNKVKAAHKAEKEPHLTAGREVDAWQASTLTPLNVFLSECKALVGAWQDKKEAEERAARDAAARQLALAREAAERKALETMTPAAMNRAADIAEAAEVAAQAAAASTADLARVTVGGKAVAARSAKWTYEVTKLADVPRQYLTINDAAVKAAIAGEHGLREIPGLRIYQAKTTSFR